MRAMVLEQPGQPLALRELPIPQPGDSEVLLRVRTCGVCRTDLHLQDGELPPHRLPVVPGHQIVGEVVALGRQVGGLRAGQRVGVPWLGWTCGECDFCRRGQENLCDRARFTGYDRDGGFAEFTVADARFCLALPQGYGDLEVAPLLCAGLIGFRALRLTGEARRLGLYGFGSAAHILTQVARFQGREVYAFTRPGDAPAQAFARSLGAAWAGGSDEVPPEELDGAVLLAPVGSLVPAALAVTRKGGSVVCGGIHMSDLPGFPYRLLWGERVLRSVANLTRADAHDFLALAPQVPVHTRVQTFALEAANEALAALRAGEVQGSAVVQVA